MVFDFYDKLKGMSNYASMDYEFKEFEASDLVKVDVLINGDKVDALSMICHRSTSYKGRELTQKLQKIINRQQFDVAIQAAIGAKILARETVKALRKNVLAKSVMAAIFLEKKTPRKTEGRKEADESCRERRASTGSVSGGAKVDE